jgi:preprotein translocase SecE subunit
MDTNTRWVVIGFLAIGLVIAWVLGESVEYLFFYLRRFNIRDMELLGQAFTLANLIGFGITAVAGILIWRNEGINTAAHEVVDELRKVTWPDQEETQTSTIVVIVSTVIFALVFAIFDLVWKWATSLIYGV